MFNAQGIRLVGLEAGIVEMVFDRTGERINKFDRRTVGELREAVAQLAAMPDLRGVLVTSTKDVFIVGADITEFGETFKLAEAELAADTLRSNEVFIGFEALPVPSVVAINGYALGGGLEMALACAGRVMAEGAEVGLPEVKLGLFPGFGGTVRLPRVAGLANACEWIADGRPRGAAEALAAGVVDAVCAPDRLRETALARLRTAIDGGFDWRMSQGRKRLPLPLPAGASASDAERASIAATRERAAGRAREANEPAALAAVDLMIAAATLDGDAAQQAEATAFAKVALTPAAHALVKAFLDGQAAKRAARHPQQQK